MKKIIVIFLLAGISLVSCTNEKASESRLNNSPAGENTSLPWLFTGPSGKVWLSWISQTDTTSTLYYSEAKTEGWSEPKAIARSSDWFVNWADYPMLISNDSGKFAAMVLEKSGPGKFSYNIRVFTSTDGGQNWADTFLLNDDGQEAEHGFVSMIPYKGKILFSWLDGRQTVSAEKSMDEHEGHHGSMTLRTAVTDYTGKKIAEWMVDDRTCDCCHTTLWAGDNGPVVFYRDRSEKEIRDLYVSRLENGAWTNPVAVHDDGWEIKGCPVNGPRSAGSGNHVAVAWFTASGDEPKVFTALSADGAKTFGKPIRIDDGHPNGRVDIIENENGDFIASWLEGEEIKVRTINKSGEISSSVSIATTSSSRPSGFPQMTAMNNGNILFAWTDIKDKKVKTKVVNLRNR